MYYAVAQLREMETRYRNSMPPLMARAGAAAAAFVTARFGRARPVLCLAGPGNNGGDALVCARLLKSQGYDVNVVKLQGTAPPPADAARALQAWQAEGGTLCATISQRDYLITIDGLFGIGLQRDLVGAAADLVAEVNTLACPVLSLDIPSGIHADTGAVLGRAIRARWTLSFIGRARGLATGAAIDYCGESLLDTLGLPAPEPCSYEVIDTAQLTAQLTRRRDSHKGSYGTLGIIGGSSGMQGAAYLAGIAAIQAGAGKVRLGLLDDRFASAASAQPEIMHAAPTDLILAPLDTLIIGPGLGQSQAALETMRSALSAPCPLLLDADALNLVAQHADIARQLKARKHPTVLTPHPAEAARLLGCATTQVQADRFSAAEQLCKSNHTVVVLKGAGSLIQGPSRCAINRTGSAALANAGQGDVLSGLIGGLLAQGLPAWEAAALGTCLHGAASDMLVDHSRVHVTPASDVARAANKVLGKWISRSQAG